MGTPEHRLISEYANREQLLLAAPCLYESDDHVAGVVFVIFLLPFPFCKLSLTFLALGVGDDVRQEAAGNGFDGVLWYL